MMIVGCDYHPSFQQIVFVDTETGELREQRLEHREPAEKFYRDLATRAVPRFQPNDRTDHFALSHCREALGGGVRVVYKAQDIKLDGFPRP